MAIDQRGNNMTNYRYFIFVTYSMSSYMMNHKYNKIGRERSENNRGERRKKMGSWRISIISPVPRTNKAIPTTALSSYRVPSNCRVTMRVNQ